MTPADPIYSLPTNVGTAKLAYALANSLTVQISHMAIGDGNGVAVNPTAAWPALAREVHRAQLNQLYQHPDNPSWLVAELVIPAEVGGWTIREIALYDVAGDLIFIGNHAEQYKPVQSQGSDETKTIRMVILVSDVATVTLKTDPTTVMATIKFVNDSVAAAATEATQAEAEAGLDGTRKMTPRRVWQAITKRFSTQAQAEAGADDATAMTPLRVFQAIAAKVVQATETVLGIAKVATQAQVTTGTDDATIVTPKKLRAAQATQAEAEAGTDNTKTMTALRVLQAMRSAAAVATELVRGVLRVGTQAEVNAGVLDDVAVTPQKLRWGFVISLTAAGYIVFPTWLGGLIIQWSLARAFVASGATTDVSSLPIAFPGGRLATIIGHYHNGSATESPIVMRNAGTTLTQTTVYCANASAGATGYQYLTIGY